MQWESMLQESDDDVAACKLLFDGGVYGRAAYSAQQCLEKIIKAYLLKNNLYTGTPESLGHLTFTRLVETLLNRVTRSKRRLVSSRKSASHIDKLMIKALEIREHFLARLKNYFYNLKDTDLKTSMWKYSLGLQTDYPAVAISEAYRTYNSKDKQIILQLYDALRNQIKQFPDNTKLVLRNFLAEHGAPVYVGEFYTGLSSITSEQLFDLVEAEKEWKMTPHYILKMLRENIPQMVRLRQVMEDKFLDETERLYGITQIFEYAELMSRIYPHEEIGRYSVRPIEGKEPYEIYKEHKENLRQLIDEVIAAREKIKARLQAPS